MMFLVELDWGLLEVGMVGLVAMLKGLAVEMDGGGCGCGVWVY